MTTLNAFDRQCLADMLRREGIAAVLSERAWLLVEAELTKPVAEPPASLDEDRFASTRAGE